MKIVSPCSICERKFKVKHQCSTWCLPRTAYLAAISGQNIEPEDLFPPVNPDKLVQRSEAATAASARPDPAKTRKYHPVTPPDIEEFVRRFKAGDPAAKIARDLGFDPGTVRRYLRESTFYKSIKQLDPNEKRRIKRLFAAGNNLNQIAVRIGRHHDTVKTFLTRAGLYTGNNHYLTEDEKRKIVALRQKNAATPISQIAAAVSRSYNTVYNFINKRGCGYGGDRQSSH